MTTSPGTMIQPCASVDQPGWIDLRRALWPEGSDETHRREMAGFLSQPERYAQFVAYAPDGTPAGFVEAAIRTDYVNGTESSPVAFLEGIYVAPPGARAGRCQTPRASGGSVGACARLLRAGV